MISPRKTHYVFWLSVVVSGTFLIFFKETEVNVSKLNERNTTKKTGHARPPIDAIDVGSGTENIARTTRLDTLPSTEYLIRKIETAAKNILEELKNQEITRTEFIKKVDSDTHSTLFFSVSQDPNLNKIILKLIDSVAESYDIQPKALKREIGEELEEFSIPEGKIKKILISIPHDTSQPYTAVIGIDDKNSLNNIGNELSFSGRMATMSVSQKTENWRYGSLLKIAMQRE